MSLVPDSERVPLNSDANGVLRIGNTRVTLDTVVYAFCDGATAEEILQQYPSLQLAEVYSVIAYFLRRKTEVDAYLRERECEAAKIRQENESRFDPVGVRNRLMARQPRKE